MSTADARKRLTSLLAVVCILSLCCVAAFAGRQGGAQANAKLNEEIANLVGDWSGESICTGDNPACHDEHVVYHISRSKDAPDKVILAADKIINGRPEEMYVLDFKYDAEKHTLTGEFSNPRYHGLFEYTVKGRTMEGTLSLLPARTIGRRIKVKKDE